MRCPPRVDASRQERSCPVKMQRIAIRNFRSIREVSISLEPFTALIGPNNHGKSNVLLALDFFFNPGAKLTADDFFVHREPDDAPVVVEVRFGELTEQDRTTFRKYLLDGGNLCVQKTARTEGGSVVQEYHGYLELAAEPWLSPDRAADYTTRDAVAGLPEAFRALLPPSGRISRANVEEAQQRYIAEHRSELVFETALETGPFMGARTVAAGLLGDYYLLPAVHDVADETKVQSTTSFGRLLSNAIREMAEQSDDFLRIRSELEELVSSLNSRSGPRGNQGHGGLEELERALAKELDEWKVSVSIEVAPPEIERLFQLGTTVFMDDGVRTSVDCKGHGLQRCFLFALFKAWAATLRRLRQQEDDGTTRRAPTQSLFFAIEEPELFLHPQAQRQMLSSLQELASAPDHQVLLCTHSSSFVDMEFPRSICIISKPTPERGTSSLQCCTDLFSGEGAQERKRRFNMAYWFNPDRSELFFARRVVLVEGATEKTLLPFVADRMGAFRHDVTLVDCGGKFSLSLYIAVLNAFGLRYVVLHDEDPVTVDAADKRYEEQKRTFAENVKIRDAVDPALGAIHCFEPELERIIGVSSKAAEKKSKPLAALEHFLDEAAEIPPSLRAAVALAYAE